MVIRGACHCRNITFRFIWDPAPSEIPARACDCQFCTKHGAAWTSKPTGKLEVTVGDGQQVSRYSFGTRTAEFLVCAKCGGVPVVTSRINEHLYAVVNVNAFENLEPALLRRIPASFDDEEEVDRLARRKRNWIADVVFIGG